jgi:hypothetical protein
MELDNKQVTIRLARAGDAERMAVLSQQLGYPASAVAATTAYRPS